MPTLCRPYSFVLQETEEIGKEIRDQIDKEKEKQEQKREKVIRGKSFPYIGVQNDTLFQV